MTFAVFVNVCQFVAAAGGLADFVVSSIPAGKKSPAQAVARNATVYRYYAQSADGEEFEEGQGAYTVGSTSLARTVIYASSNTGAKVDFTAPPTVDVFPSPLPSLEMGDVLLAPANTTLVFYQAAAPFGWTKVTTHNDKAMRVVNGATGGGSGGSLAFSTVFGRFQVDSHANTIAEMPPHHHAYTRFDGTYSFTGSGAPQSPDPGPQPYIPNYATLDTGDTGGGAAHVHGMDIRVQYVDVILCKKD